MPNLIKKLPSEIKKNKLKTSVFLGLSAYWVIILVGTSVEVIKQIRTYEISKSYKEML